MPDLSPQKEGGGARIVTALRPEVHTALRSGASTAAVKSDMGLR